MRDLVKTLSVLTLLLSVPMIADAQEQQVTCAGHPASSYLSSAADAERLEQSGDTRALRRFVEKNPGTFETRGGYRVYVYDYVRWPETGDMFAEIRVPGEPESFYVDAEAVQSAPRYCNHRTAPL